MPTTGALSTITSFEILDTGFPSLTPSGDRNSFLANSGNAIVLATAELSLRAGASMDDNTSPSVNVSNATTNPKGISFVSVQHPIIQVRGKLRRNVSTDMDLVAPIFDLQRTTGIKILYYKSTTDGYRDLLDGIGIYYQSATGASSGVPYVNDAHIGAAVSASTGVFFNTNTPHVHVYVKGVTFSQVPTSQMIDYTLDCEVIDI
ncbi:hypothetical protein HYU06_05850 [Candidatus Woesearchaeota archaeon]|nr:hypothetical protein [Candidatus Woesearchaeota archaeon]